MSSTGRELNVVRWGCHDLELRMAAALCCRAPLAAPIHRLSSEAYPVITTVSSLRDVGDHVCSSLQHPLGASARCNWWGQELQACSCVCCKEELWISAGGRLEI